MAETIGMDYVEVSAKTGVGVKEMFDTLLTKITEKHEHGFKASTSAVDVTENDYSIRVTSTARNTPPEDRLCCNIF
jgi:GTPase SAR1 family protein